jgi:hypothetical protein
MSRDLHISRRWTTRPLRLLTAGLLAASALLGSGVTSPAPTTAAASSSSVYWGAYISGAPFTSSLMDNFESDAGKPMSIIHWGESWIRGTTTQEFQAYYMQRVRDRGSIPMLTWGSWDSSKGPTQSNFQLADVYNGTYDSYITEWATDAKLWGHPYFLRFDHEMNGNWQFPWSEQINGNNPGDYIKAWRHVHDIFTQVGATNTTWVWCPNVVGTSTRALSALYPGDSYVDWTCLDGYNSAADAGNQWQSFAQVFSGLIYGGYNKKDSFAELKALAPSKPVMLGEVSSSENGGSKANWITDMFSTQLKTNFSVVKAVVWTNWNDNPNKTWPIESSAASQAAFTAAIGSSYYAANDFASMNASVIQPLGGAPAPTATPIPPTATPIPPTATPVPPTATATATRVPSTATPTATAVPPTATATATRVPPTATATATRVPSTATPTATRVPTSTPTTVPVAQGIDLSVVPVADTFTSWSAPTSTAGGISQTLRADLSGSDTAFLRFDLTPLAGKTITSAILRLHSSSDSFGGSGSTFDVDLVGSTDWKEAYMSFNNTVPISTTSLGTLLGPSNPNTWYQVMVNPMVLQAKAGKLVSMAISGQTGDVFIFNSRESGAAFAPQLIVSYQ